MKSSASEPGLSLHTEVYLAGDQDSKVSVGDQNSSDSVHPTLCIGRLIKA